MSLTSSPLLSLSTLYVVKVVAIVIMHVHTRERAVAPDLMVSKYHHCRQYMSLTSSPLLSLSTVYVVNVVAIAITIDIICR